MQHLELVERAALAPGVGDNRAMSVSEAQLESAVVAMLSFDACCTARLEREARALAPCLPKLPSLVARLEAQREAIRSNAVFLRRILQELELIHGDADEAADDADEVAHAIVVGALAQMKREWSDDAAEERLQSFGVAREALLRHLPVGSEAPKVLVPGSALGRLVYDLASVGYDCTGCESSYHMLVPAWYVLQKLVGAGRQEVFYPHALDATNVSEAANLSRAVRIPGEPAKARQSDLGPLRMRLVASAFEEMGRDAAHTARWDAVCSVFFTDACQSALDCIASVHALLRPGGLWVNVGPFLYPAGFGQQQSQSAAMPRLCADEFLQLVGQSGFELVESRILPSVAYCRDEASMCKAEYRCLFFVARREA